MLKKTCILIILLMTTLTLTACHSDCEMNVYELIDVLNTEYNYTFNIEDFLVEKKESIIYHTMTDNNTLLSLYSTKNETIIQCTLSSFNTNNLNLFRTISKILIKCDEKTILTTIRNAQQNGSCEQNGWKITIIENDIGSTYILNHVNAEINNSAKPTLKNKID